MYGISSFKIKLICTHIFCIISYLKSTEIMWTIEKSNGLTFVFYNFVYYTIKVVDIIITFDSENNLIFEDSLNILNIFTLSNNIVILIFI